MKSIIWNKYQKIKEKNSNSNIKTYLARIELIIKEIIPNNIDEYLLIKDKLEQIKNIIKIYEIIEENDKIYVIIENNNEIILKFDELILLDNIKKEGILEGQGNPVSRQEIFELLEMEKSMCKISFIRKENNKIIKGHGTGFFCKIDNFPIKYALFTNNHILNEYNLKLDKKINIEYLNNIDNIKNPLYIKKEIKINEKRRVYTNKEMDYTCIEIFESDGIYDYFEIDPILFTINENDVINDLEIFILQYPKGNELSFSYGKILKIKDNNKIIHSGSTEGGSSGSPIIRRDNNKYIIGLHYGGVEKNNKNYSYNLATIFDSILNDIYKSNEINCIYIIKDNDKEIQLLL